jgi:Flp pilus assembly protein TadG
MSGRRSILRQSFRRTRREGGQAYVEFAFVLPLLMVIVLGIIQFGNAFRTYITLTDAVRVGARQAAISRSIQPDSDRVPLIEQKIKSAAASLDPNKLVITVDPHDPTNGAQGWFASGDVTVRASYPFKINLLGLVVFDSRINSRTTERVE